jgi:cytochrome c biogenesis protein CcdA
MKPYKVMARILLVLFIVSFIYSILGIIFSTSNRIFVYHRSNIEYIKISLQCILGSAVLFLPSALEHKFKISFSNGIHIFFVLFLYGAIILGEVRGYYRRFYHWDTILHTLSGVMLSSFGFCIIDIINKIPRPKGRGILRFLFAIQSNKDGCDSSVILCSCL